MAYIFALSFMPGNLSIFYGDEVGIQGIGNLNNRKPFPWDNLDNKLLDFFRFIGYIRNNEKFLEQANFRLSNASNNILSFERINGEEQAFIAINRTNQEQLFYVPSDYQEAEKVYTLKKSRPGLLAPYGGIAIKK